MKFAKLEEMARAMPEQQVEGSLRSLTADPRFAAVIAIVLRHKEQFVDGGAEQTRADRHGALAHTAGAVYALNCLLGAVKQVSNPPKKRTPKGPEPEEN